MLDVLRLSRMEKQHRETVNAKRPNRLKSPSRGDCRHRWLPRAPLRRTVKGRNGRRREDRNQHPADYPEPDVVDVEGWWYTSTSMFEVALPIIDRLIQLATVREKRKQYFFNNYIEPLYRDAESIVRDYDQLLTEIIQQIRSASDTLAVITWMDDRRRTLLPIRTKVRALLSDNTKFDSSAALDRFKKGVWGLLKGGVALLDEGHGITGEYGFGGHTALDLMRTLRADPLEYHRARFLEHVFAQQRSLEAAWRDVVKGYVDLKHESMQ